MDYKNISDEIVDKAEAKAGQVYKQIITEADQLADEATDLYDEASRQAEAKAGEVYEQIVIEADELAEAAQDLYDEAGRKATEAFNKTLKRAEKAVVFGLPLWAVVAIGVGVVALVGIGGIAAGV